MIINELYWGIVLIVGLGTIFLIISTHMSNDSSSVPPEYIALMAKIYSLKLTADASRQKAKNDQNNLISVRDELDKYLNLEIKD